jgi:hypothetical protein
MPEPGQQGVDRRIDWFAASAGLVLAVLLQLAGGALLFPHGASLAGQQVFAFGALLVAGFAAGRLGPLAGGVWNGMLVAIGFIVVEALARTITDVQLMGPAVSAHGSDMGGLVVGDVVVLSGGTLGGWLSRFARMRIAR